MTYPTVAPLLPTAPAVHYLPGVVCGGGVDVEVRALAHLEHSNAVLAALERRFDLLVQKDL